MSSGNRFYALSLEKQAEICERFEEGEVFEGALEWLNAVRDLLKLYEYNSSCNLQVKTTMYAQVKKLIPDSLKLLMSDKRGNNFTGESLSTALAHVKWLLKYGIEEKEWFGAGIKYTDVFQNLVVCSRSKQQTIFVAHLKLKSEEVVFEPIPFAADEAKTLVLYTAQASLNKKSCEPTLKTATVSLLERKRNIEALVHAAGGGSKQKLKIVLISSATKPDLIDFDLEDFDNKARDIINVPVVERYIKVLGREKEFEDYTGERGLVNTLKKFYRSLKMYRPYTPAEDSDDDVLVAQKKPTLQLVYPSVFANALSLAHLGKLLNLVRESVGYTGDDDEEGGFLLVGFAAKEPKEPELLLNTSALDQFGVVDFGELIKIFEIAEEEEEIVLGKEQLVKGGIDASRAEWLSLLIKAVGEPTKDIVRGHHIALTKGGKLAGKILRA
ncbi:hypothetical protein NBRC10512_001276 [Rhodotorula toruloides]|uniref:RHTO0S16e00738g1_1 n=2 Tax=Rhodotorula toruloides TaxID=5286 RepID=A0A061BDS3_RHOTO|nr:uncharacterized protein RHTO_02185 [Rhodotorula toruloides NP11]EMS20953.1 hypothetical protein RHTO_02185 [Rhodotorula toruloides NP11]CDR48076.1 RHTO0S16e00738g1_1 [Rhodotorula toruloides]